MQKINMVQEYDLIADAELGDWRKSSQAPVVDSRQQDESNWLFIESVITAFSSCSFQPVGCLPKSQAYL